MSRSRKHEADFCVGDQSLTGWWVWTQRYEAAQLAIASHKKSKYCVTNDGLTPRGRPHRTGQRESDMRHELVPGGLFADQIQLALLLCWAPALLSWYLARSSLTENGIFGAPRGGSETRIRHPFLAMKPHSSHHAGLGRRIQRSGS